MTNFLFHVEVFFKIYFSIGKQKKSFDIPRLEMYVNAAR